MEKRVLNRRDMECLKNAMIKHDQTFKEQLHELHRLYQIQKMLMKDGARKSSPHYVRACSRAEARRGHPESGEECTRASEAHEDDDQDDLELTLGPRSYYQLKKIKAPEPDFESESGISFSSSSTGSSGIKGVTPTRDEFSTRKKLWGPEMPVSNNVNHQDRLSSPPWLFQALSLNIT